MLQQESHKGKIVLAVASSGITSLLLPAGRTAHSRFKLPLELTDESLCQVKKNTQLGKLLVETNLIIWDEAPMNDRRCFETLDRTLRDLMSSPDLIFGGKTVVLGGDFRQTLPVKKRSDLNAKQQQRAKVFAKWLLDIGNDEMGEPDNEDDQNSCWISIPPEYCVSSDDGGMSELIDFIYDQTTLKTTTAGALNEKAIGKTYLSKDEAIPMGKETSETELLYPMEYLNTISFPGFPPHELHLKVGSPIMLLRNVNLSGGLCNGTRMIVTSLMSRLIEAQIITGTRVGDKVYIHRIPLTHKDPNLSFTFKRTQFPIKLCYAMTINKSQGQSLSRIVYNQLSSRVPYRDENSKTVYPMLTDLQLSATSATYYYINPQTPEAEYAYTEYRYENLEQEKLRNRQTLHTLIQQNPETFPGVRFTCKATITFVAENRSRNYSSCSECNKKSTTVDGYKCEDHGIQEPLTYRYNFKATISDATAVAYFTFFTKAGEKITGGPCFDLVAKYKSMDHRQLPIELVNFIGKTQIFQIHFTPSTRRGFGQFTVVDILDIQPALETKHTGITLDATTTEVIEESTSKGKDKSALFQPPKPAVLPRSLSIILFVLLKSAIFEGTCRTPKLSSSSRN
ncbi:DNA helicase [Tanacetum coccineum]